MENIWFASALWVGLALVAAILQNWVAVFFAVLSLGERVSWWDRELFTGHPERVTGSWEEFRVVLRDHADDVAALRADGVIDRLSLTQRAEKLFELHKKHKPMQVRYERYGMMGDIAHIKHEMEQRQYRFKVTERSDVTLTLAGPSRARLVLLTDGGRRMDEYLARVLELFPPLADRLSSKGKTLSAHGARPPWQPTMPWIAPSPRGGLLPCQNRKYFCAIGSSVAGSQPSSWPSAASRSHDQRKKRAYMSYSFVFCAVLSAM